MSGITTLARGRVGRSELPLGVRGTRRLPPSRYGVSAAVTVICVAVGFVVAQIPESPIATSTGLFAVIALVAALYPIVRRVTNGTIDVLEPVLAAGLMLAAIFGVRPLVMLSTGNLLLDEKYNVSADFRQATIIGMLGTLAFSIGYELIFRTRSHDHKVPRPPIALRVEPAKRAVFWLATIGMGLFLIQLARSGNPLSTLKLLSHGRSAAAAEVETTTAYLSDAPLLLSCGATILLIVLGPRLRRSQVYAILSLIAVPLIAFSLVGDRRFIIPSVAVPFIVYYLVRAKRPAWRNLALVVPIVFVILATIPFARSAGAREPGKGVFDIFTKALSEPLKPIGAFFTSSDTEMIPALSLEVNTLSTPSSFYFGRATGGDLLFAPVPSAIIPKPESARNDLLMRLFGKPCAPVNGGLCPDFSSVGTFYQDFWYPGAIVGMLLLGAFSAVLWARFIEAPQDTIKLLLAASWAVFLPIIIRAGFMPPFSWWLEFLAPLWLAMRFITKRSSPEPHNRLEPRRTRNPTTPMPSATACSLYD